MKKQVKIPQCDIVISDFLGNDVCEKCIKMHCDKYESIKCPLTGNTSRIGNEKKDSFELFACSEESKTTKNFKNEFNLLVEMIPYMPSLIKELAEDINDDYENRFLKFIHNISTINARCIQVFESLGFTKLDRGDVSQAIKRAKSIITKNTEKTARSLFDIMKFESMTKVEMLVFDQLYNRNGQTFERDYHSVRDVIMLTLHRFFYDFNLKGVYVDVEENYDKVYFNYESFSCSLYYIIENATKYVKPNSEVNIKFCDNENEYCAFLTMQSHYLSENDRKHIFDEGYSGEIARNQNLSGHGYGMYRAKKLLSAYGMKIDFDYGNTKEMYENICYAKNTIKISIPILQGKPVRKNWNY